MEKIYPRRLKNLLLSELNKPGIVLITGMRQVGKTTLLNDIFNYVKTENKILLDLENPLYQKIFEEENYDNIIYNLAKIGLNSKYKSYVFIDEIQIIPWIVKPIKYLYDHYNIKFFLTGSSSFYLKNLFPESLAGRKRIYELFPLDFEEFLIFKEKRNNFISFNNENIFRKKLKQKNRIEYQLYIKLYEEYLTYGGFPAVVIEDDIFKKRLILADIFKSYFEKDIRTIADFKEINNLRDTILLLAARVGSKIDISKISSELGISRPSIYSYLNFLEKTYFISLLSPFSQSINGEVRGAKKVYFCDNGLLNYLVNLPEGVLFENAVFNILKKYGDLNYYQKYKGGEIDFILNKKIGFEVKLKSTLTDIKKVKRLSAKLDLKAFYIITKTFNEYPETIVAVDLL